MLATGVAEYADMSDLIDDMVSSFDLNGPAICIDSSIRFLSIVAPLRCKVNIGSIPDTLERILRWVFIRWSPSKLICLVRRSLI